MKLSANEIIKLLQQEIKWCKENPPARFKLSDSYGLGFVKGLKQAILIINGAKRSQRLEKAKAKENQFLLPDDIKPLINFHGSPNTIRVHGECARCHARYTVSNLMVDFHGDTICKCGSREWKEVEGR